MTTKQILRKLAAAGKKVGLMQLYRYLSACGIKPSGARQRPQRYPDDSAERVKRYLGISTASPGPSASPAFETPSRRTRNQAPKMKEQKTEEFLSSEDLIHGLYWPKNMSPKSCERLKRCVDDLRAFSVPDEEIAVTLADVYWLGFEHGNKK